MITTSHILAEIQRTASGDSPLGRKQFEDETGIKESDWLGRFWTRWSDAVREAGYEPNTLQSAFAEDHLLQCLVVLIRELGKFPTSADLKMKAKRDSDFPSHNTFNRLDPKPERARRVVEFCASRDNLDDVEQLAKPLAALSPQVNSDACDKQVENLGFVYLMKSGKYYKIGRSVSPEKRAYEIRLITPEDIKLIHKIKTDDPVGIERYWHQRFKEKRFRGEWFSLTHQEVSAFKRRNFM